MLKVSQSKLTTYLECKRKAKLQDDGWYAVKKSDSLIYGGLGHDLLEECYKDKWDGAISDLTYPEEIENSLEEYFHNKGEDHFIRLGIDEQKYILWETQFRVLIPEYFKYWGKKENEYEWLGIEQVVADIPFSKHMSLNGRLDYTFKQGDDIWFLDSKFLSRVEVDTIELQLEGDFQLLFYALLLKKKHGVLPKGCVYNIIRRPGLDLKKKESLPKYADRLRKHIYDNDPDHYYKRFPVKFSQSKLDRFEQDLKNILNDYYCWITNGKPSTLYGNPCIGKYGVCKFFRMCHFGSTTGYSLKVKKDKPLATIKNTSYFQGSVK